MSTARKWYRIFTHEVLGGSVQILTSPPHMAGYRDSYRLRLADSDGKRITVDVFKSDLRSLRDELNKMDLNDYRDRSA
jgi:hypothetical protein